MSHTTDQEGNVLVKPDVSELQQKLSNQNLTTQQLLQFILLELVKINIHLAEADEEDIEDGDLTEGLGVGR